MAGEGLNSFTHGCQAPVAIISWQVTPVLLHTASISMPPVRYGEGGGRRVARARPRSALRWRAK